MPKTKTTTDELAVLRDLLARQKSLPDEINAEVVRLVDAGVPQARIAEAVGLSRQEVSRRYKQIR